MKLGIIVFGLMLMAPAISGARELQSYVEKSVIACGYKYDAKFLLDKYDLDKNTPTEAEANERADCYFIKDETSCVETTEVISGEVIKFSPATMTNRVLWAATTQPTVFADWGTDLWPKPDLSWNCK